MSLLTLESSAIDVDSHALRDCSICGNNLPLRAPRPGEIAIDWICVECDSVYHAVLIDNCDEKLRRRVHPVAFRFLEEELPAPPTELLDFAQKLSVLDSRRQLQDSKRRSLSVPVMAVPLTADLQPAGESFMPMTRNISAAGMTLTSEVMVETKFLAVQLPKTGERSLQLAMKIIRQRPIGNYFEIVGLFITRMYV